MPAAILRLTGRYAGVLLFLVATFASAAPLTTLSDHASAIGRSTFYLQETSGPLDLPAAMAAQRAGRFTSGQSPVLNFGIGAKPVWIHFTVVNPGSAPVQKRLTIETAWLDSIEIHFVRQGKTVEMYRAGDRMAFGQRPIASPYFLFDYDFAPGESEVFLRVETPDPMVIPLYLQSRENARIRQMRQDPSYGVVYGFLLALMAYNVILYASLRGARYLSYALYLAMFALMNIAYTGHGFAWLWPNSTHWQQWANPILIFLYGASGLFFAIRFLELRKNFPRVYRAVIAYCLAVGGLLGAAILLDAQKQALLVSFSFVFLFTCIMLALGVAAIRAGQKSARYFLIAAFAAMVGAALTTLSTWGFIPFNGWTFRAVEIGMLLDATLLALALAYQFRVGQEEKLRAEQLAQLDPLTGLNNRRAFYELTTPLWNVALRHGHALSVMVLDIDLFKHVNDDHGHAHGDAVLKQTADVLKRNIRQSDILARWGGEEFIVLMPETPLREANVLAERLRAAIAQMRVERAEGATAVTASFGVAQRDERNATLDALIECADNCLYDSKQNGRNQITSCALATDGTS